ncbi:Exonuclease [Candidatus Desulfarcum epimagneticum]|uniref:Exonuclease n=1 Tax=uncultured Desulfobacteraceae bacterium TaxID=218296 RepID=A0A484HL49_9BACT|nr:Exonuclease [uncultured Desulfobacteraceae bacterium]
MGLLSSTSSLARYMVRGKPDAPIIETARRGLSENRFREIDQSAREKSVGWTSLETPYRPDFEDSSFLVGPFFIFALRVDKKKVPPKLFKKHHTLAMEEKLAKSGRDFLSRDEKSDLKESVLNALLTRMPATPDIYDVVWNVEESWAWFFSGTKSANEDFETLFSKSFNLSVIRLFPYSEAGFASGLDDSRQSLLSKLQPTQFAG